MKGKVHVLDDFDAPLPMDIQDAFEKADGICGSESDEWDKYVKYDKGACLMAKAGMIGSI